MKEIYAISLWQPWASLIAIGAKPFETRDWFPPKWLIGHRIAIHAAMRPMPRDAEDQEDFTEAFGGRGWRATLPKGAIVCTAVLAGAYQCGRAVGHESVHVIRGISGSLALEPLGCEGRIPLDTFGDYAPDRVAWWLTDIEPLHPPLMRRGRQGYWKELLP